MRRARYYYNPVTCSYERIKTPLYSWIIRGGVCIASSTILAVFMAKLSKEHFVSSREVELMEVNEKLRTYYEAVQQKIESSTAILAALQEKDNKLYRVLLNTEPLSPAEQNAGSVGVNKYAHLGNDTLIVQTLSRADQLMNKLTVQKKSYEELTIRAQKAANKLRSIRSLPPIPKII